MELFSRNVEAELREALGVSRVVVILGPRQAGKSTLARQIQRAGIIPEEQYYSFDDDTLRERALGDPAGFIADIGKPAIIDEVQRVPALLLAIKRFVDEHPDRRGQFLLTGSSNLLDNQRVADALPGRVIYINLWPFSQDEIHGERASLIDRLLAGLVPRITASAVGRSAYAEAVVRGGFPEARTIDSPRLRERFFGSYVQGILRRDLFDVADARVDPAIVEQVLNTVAHRSTQLVNYSELGRDLGLDRQTFRRHLALLEQLFLVQTLRPWSRNLASRPVKSPKLLVTDSGLAAALIGVDASRFAAVDQGDVGGSLLETFVTMELVKQQTWARASAKLFFYRDRDQREVDVVIESAAGDLAGVEVKSAASVSARDAKGLAYLRDAYPDRFRAGVVAYTGEHTVALSDRIWAMPISGLWSA